MPAGWGGKKQTRRPGRYIAQIRDVKSVTGTDYQDKTKQVEQFLWEIDVQQPDGSWASDKIYTGKNFTDIATVTDPQFISKLTRLVRASGQRLPTSAAEAAAWDENSMIGLRFGIVVQQDEETGVLQEKWVRLQQAPQPAPVAQPQGYPPQRPPQYPAPQQPPAPQPQPSQYQASQPAPPQQVPQPAPAPVRSHDYPHDPFEGDAGAAPAAVPAGAPAAARVAGDDDIWA